MGELEYRFKVRGRVWHKSGWSCFEEYFILNREQYIQNFKEIFNGKEIEVRFVKSNGEVL